MITTKKIMKKRKPNQGKTTFEGMFLEKRVGGLREFVCNDLTRYCSSPRPLATDPSILRSSCHVTSSEPLC